MHLHGVKMVVPLPLAVSSEHSVCHSGRGELLSEPEDDSVADEVLL